MIYEDYFIRMNQLFESVYNDYEQMILTENTQITKDGIINNDAKKKTFLKWICVALKAVWKKIADIYDGLARKLKAIFNAEKVILTDDISVYNGIINCTIAPFKKAQKNTKYLIKSAKNNYIGGEAKYLKELENFNNIDIKQLEQLVDVKKGTTINITKIHNFYKSISKIARECVKSTEFYEPNGEIQMSKGTKYSKELADTYMQVNGKTNLSEEKINDITNDMQNKLKNGVFSKKILSTAAFNIVDFAKTCNTFINEVKGKSTSVNNESINFNDTFEI